MSKVCPCGAVEYCPKCAEIYKQYPDWPGFIKAIQKGLITHFPRPTLFNLDGLEYKQNREKAERLKRELIQAWFEGLAKRI